MFLIKDSLSGSHDRVAWFFAPLVSHKSKVVLFSSCEDKATCRPFWEEKIDRCFSFTRLKVITLINPLFISKQANIIQHRLSILYLILRKLALCRIQALNTCSDRTPFLLIQICTRINFAKENRRYVLNEACMKSTKLLPFSSGRVFCLIDSFLPRLRSNIIIDLLLS